MTKSILLAGVGGQGIILVSTILTEGLLKLKFDVKMSEIHGMAQRGGSVNTHIRFGNKVNSPVISKGGSDLFIAFEKLEAVRYIQYLKPGGTLILNDHEIYSLPILTGRAKYPEAIIEKLEDSIESISIIKASSVAKDLGNEKVQNIVLLGAIVRRLGFLDLNWIDLIKTKLPQKFHEINIRAFNTGVSL